MQNVKVDLEDRSYTVYIGAGLLVTTHPAFDTTEGGTALIVSNETVAPLYLESLTR